MDQAWKDSLDNYIIFDGNPHEEDIGEEEEEEEAQTYKDMLILEVLMLQKKLDIHFYNVTTLENATTLELYEYIAKYKNMNKGN